MSYEMNKRRVVTTTSSNDLLSMTPSQHQSSSSSDRNYWYYTNGGSSTKRSSSRQYVIRCCIVITIIVLSLFSLLTVVYPPPDEVRGNRRHKYNDNNNNNDTPIRTTNNKQDIRRKNEQLRDIANTIMTINSNTNGTTERIWDVSLRRKLSNRQFDVSINVVEDVGSYRFIEIPECAVTGNYLCSIHFPTSSTEHTSLATLKGSKGMQQIGEDDVGDEEVVDADAENEQHVVDGSRTNQDEKPKSLLESKKLPNQDRIVLLTFTPQQKDPTEQLSSHPIGFIAGLFDGHGDFGHYSSQLASTELLLRFAQQQPQSKNEQSILQHIESSFVELDDSIAMKSIVGSGTTAIMVWQIGTVIYISSCGDSTAYLIQWNGDNESESSSYWILKSASKHKPADPVERARIEKAGTGVVLIPPPHMPQMSSRVMFIVPMLDQNDRPTGMQAQMGIAMSRSLGDIEAKDRHLLIANPTTITIDLQQYKDTSNANFFVILGTDGIFDVLTNDQIIIPLGEALYETSQQQPNPLDTTCQSLLQQAKQRWSDETQNTYRDDISLVVHRIII